MFEQAIAFSMVKIAGKHVVRMPSFKFIQRFSI